MKLTPADRLEIARQAAALDSDGCSGPTELFHICCLEHDIAYRTGETWRGEQTSRREADARFRRCMQDESKLGKASPTAWLRWSLVRAFGRGRKGVFSPPLPRQ